MCHLRIKLDIEAGREHYHRMFLLSVILICVLFIFWLVRKVLHTMEEYFKMHNSIRVLIRQRESTSLAMLDMAALSLYYRHIEVYDTT